MEICDKLSAQFHIFSVWRLWWNQKKHFCKLKLLLILTMLAEVKLVAKIDIFWRTRSMEETSSSWNHQTIKSGCKINNGAYSNRKVRQKQKVGKFPFRKSVEDIKLFLGGGLEIFRNVDRGVDVRIDACSHCGLGVWILWSTNNYKVVWKLPDSDAEKKNLKILKWTLFRLLNVLDWDLHWKNPAFCYGEKRVWRKERNKSHSTSWIFQTTNFIEQGTF